MYNNAPSAAIVTGAMLSSSGHFGCTESKGNILYKNLFLCYTFRQMSIFIYLLCKKIIKDLRQIFQYICPDMLT